MSLGPRNLSATVLVIEAAPAQQQALRQMVQAAGFGAQLAGSASEGLRLFRATGASVVLLDLDLTDRDGIALMREFLALRPHTRVIALTASAAIGRAVAAVRAGAMDVLRKPADERHLATALQSAAEADLPATGTRAPGQRRRADPTMSDGSAFVGSSAVMAQIHATIASVARSTATVFITGESGTGKELAALAVHDQSPRAAGPFIALNCGAIPPDLLESEVFGHVKGSFTGALGDKPGAAVAADGGTLFLDEVCEMAPALQTKLLRFLQTSTVQPVGATRPRHVDVRIVCATNRDPVDAVRRGHFREDLFYRLYVVPLHMPPLRDRGADAVEIAETALARYAEEEGKAFAGLTAETRDILTHHDWPGNVRQLLNVIRNVVVLHPGGEVRPDMLPLHSLRGHAAPSTAAGDDPFRGMTLARIERAAVEAALKRHGGSVPRAARELDVSPSTLYRKLDAWGIRPAS